MLRREWGAGRNWKLPHLFIHSEIAALVPAFVMEDLPLDRTAILMPEFYSEIPSLGQNNLIHIYIYIYKVIIDLDIIMQYQMISKTWTSVR